MARRALVAGVAVLIAIGMLPGHAEGQVAARRGIWFEAGTGTGTIRSACSSCNVVTVAYGRTGRIRVGTALSPRVLLGLELFTLDSSDFSLTQGVPPVDAENGSIAPVVLWYVGQSGFFLKGGVGMARGTFSATTPSGQVVTAKRTGSALSFDVGFDVGVARWLAVTANLGTYVLAIGDVHVNGNAVDDLVAIIYEASVGLTLR